MSIGIIGGLGRMGSRLKQSLKKRNYEAVIGTRDNLEDVAEKCPTVILSVKPVDIPRVCKRIGPIVNQNPNKLIIPIAAGIPHDWYFTWFDDTIHRSNIVRVMPTYFVGQETSLLGIECDDDTYNLYEGRLKDMFNPTKMYHSSSLTDMDVITATISCAPAIYARIYKALFASYINLGLSEEAARDIIQQTMAATLNNENIEQPDRLIESVASPGGATAKGLRILEDCHIDHILNRSFKETFNRCNEIRRIVGDTI